MKKIERKKIFLIISIPIFLLIILLAGTSYAAPLESGTRVKENSDLTYYIDIMYDGKDKDLVMSSDTTTAEVRSDYIYVEDKLPEGLIFKEFVSSEDGTIGAVQRGDTSKSCSGYVVDGIDGLKYDDTTRLVTFAVKNLQAGCKITVGVVTTTPFLGDKKRIDFYNTAFAREDDFSVYSNTVHAYMGEVEETLYAVNYEYTGDVPDGAPTPPESTSYTEGTTVGVKSNITLNGYIFSGWKTTDVTIDEGVFEMPASKVTFTGSFEKKQTYEVIYEIDGDKPEGYLPPTSKEYGENDIVSVDSLEPGNVINGYKFLGWETTDVTIDEGVFEMPATSVTLNGKFERISYTITYAFQGDTIPENAENLLPPIETHYPNDKITIAEEPTTEGYKFLGWYYSENFEMPEENITIYGEWMKEAGKFVPTLTKQITNPQEFYNENDIVEFKITVTNTAEYDIKDVILQNHQKGSSFKENENYTLMSNSFVQIPLIKAASSMDVYAEYTVGNEPLETFTNTITLDGALADNDYTLDTTKEYKATDTFNVANITLQIEKVDIDNNKVTGAEFTLYEDSTKETIISTGTTFKNLLPETTYYLYETKAPTGYVLLGKTLEVKVDENGIITIEDYNVANNEGTATVNIVNQKINILPNTGGSGNIPYVMIGLVIIIVGVIVLIFYISKKKRSQK